MNVFFYKTKNGSKGIVYADYDFEANSHVADYYRIECDDVELKKIESLEELKSLVGKGHVIGFD